MHLPSAHSGVDCTSTQRRPLQAAKVLVNHALAIAYRQLVALPILRLGRMQPADNNSLQFGFRKHFLATWTLLTIVTNALPELAQVLSAILRGTMQR